MQRRYEISERNGYYRHNRRRNREDREVDEQLSKKTF